MGCKGRRQRVEKINRHKDRDRGMILRLLDLVEETNDPKYIPLLEAWAAVDYKKVRARIGQVMRRIGADRSQGGL